MHKGAMGASLLRTRNTEIMVIKEYDNGNGKDIYGKTPSAGTAERFRAAG